MTREEISVLSSARRETVRRQLEETEAYRNNPLLYLFNPRITVGFYDFNLHKNNELLYKTLKRAFELKSYFPAYSLYEFSMGLPLYTLCSILSLYRLGCAIKDLG